MNQPQILLRSKQDWKLFQVGGILELETRRLVLVEDGREIRYRHEAIP